MLKIGLNSAIRYNKLKQIVEMIVVATECAFDSVPVIRCKTV